MSGITLTEVDDATIATPATGKATIFMDDTLGPAYKDDGGSVTSLQGTAGADGELTYLNHGNTGASEAIDVSAADVHRLVFDAATVAVTITNWPASGTPGIVRSYIVQDGVGGRLADWSGISGLTWGAAGAPTLQTGAGAIDIIDFQSVDGGTTVLGSYEVGASATTAHIADTSDAHDASAISVLDTAANFTGTDVEAVLAELQDNIDGVGGVSHDTDEEIMGSDTALGTTLFGNDLMSMSLAAGTWLVKWKVAFSAGGNPATVKAILWNNAEDTEYDADEDTGGVSGFRFSGPHGWAIIVLGSTTTVKVSASRTSDNTASAIRNGGNGSSNRLTKMTAIRLA